MAKDLDKTLNSEEECEVEYDTEFDENGNMILVVVEKRKKNHCCHSGCYDCPFKDLN